MLTWQAGRLSSGEHGRRRLGRMLGDFRLHPPGYMAPCVLAQVVFPVEALAALGTHVALVPGMNHKVEGQLLFAFERFQTNCAHEWPVGVVALLMARQVILESYAY